MVYICTKFRENILKSYVADTVCDGQTDRHTVTGGQTGIYEKKKKKNNVSAWGRHNNKV